MIFEEKAWYVYKHTNLINNKSYIGITSQKPEYRWGYQGHNYLQQKKFYSAIQKYGWDNFSHEIILQNLTKEEALKKEAELIQQYNCILNGYNDVTNPDNNLYSKEIYCSETKEVFPSIAAAARAYNGQMSTLSHHLNGDINQLTYEKAFGKHWYFTDDKLNINHYQANIYYQNIKNQKEQNKQKEEIPVIKLYLSGKTIREINEITHYSRQKISRILKDNNIELRDNKITAIALNKETLEPIKYFETLADACEWCGLNKSSEVSRIHNAIIESWRICKGYKWSTTNEELLKIREKNDKNNQEKIIDNMVQDYNSGMTTEKIGKKYNCCRATVSKYLKNRGIVLAEGGKKPILQIDPNTKEIINRFSSIKEVYQFFNMNPNNPTLSKRCIDHQLYKGYIWYYENDF